MSLDESLGVEHVGHIALRRADRAQDTNLLFTFQYADVGYDADHDGADDQADAHKCDEHQADGVHDVGHRTHDDAHVVGVRDCLLIVTSGLDLLVVRIDVIEHALLGLKVTRENLDRDGVRLIRIAQRGQIIVVGEL